MSNKNNPSDLAEETKKIWESLAEWWSNDIGEGDSFHRHLVFPNIIKLANIKKGDKILDLGCGNGALSRVLAQLGADVVAVDFSEKFIEIAKQLSRHDTIQYKQLDLTSKETLCSLITETRYDTVVCSMVLHNMPDIQPLFSLLPQLLKPKGQFIFSIPHPCFNSGKITLNFDAEPPSVCRSTYVDPETYQIFSKEKQPIAQYAFHRSFEEIFNGLFSVGMVMDQFCEPSFSNMNVDSKMGWVKLDKISPAIVCRWVIK